MTSFSKIKSSSFPLHCREEIISTCGGNEISLSSTIRASYGFFEDGRSNITYLADFHILSSLSCNIPKTSSYCPLPIHNSPSNLISGESSSTNQLGQGISFPCLLINFSPFQ